MSYGLANPTYADQPAWAPPIAFEPRPQRYRGGFYHWCIGLLLAVGFFVGANVALGDPIAAYLKPTAAPERAAHTTIDAETNAELESLVRAVVTRLETST